MEYATNHTLFFTATVLDWKNLLKPDKYKDIVIESLGFLVKDKRVEVNAFVIMQNHIHLIWQMLNNHKRENVQRDFLKFTAQKIKNDLTKNHPEVLSKFEVNAKDRRYQFWERNPLSVDLYTEAVFIQKLEYIHLNPVQAQLCSLPEEYWYSSARFYEIGIDDFGFLTHYVH